MLDRLEEGSPARLVLRDAAPDARGQVEEQLFLRERAKGAVAAGLVALQTGIHERAGVLCRAFRECEGVVRA